MKEESQRLKKENQELSQASSYEWVWEVNSSGIYTYVSPQVEKVLGYKPQELIGKTPFDFMSEEEAVRVTNAFYEIVLGQRSFSKLVNSYLHKDGYEVKAETSGQPLHDEDGVFLGYRGVDFDRRKIHLS